MSPAWIVAAVAVALAVALGVTAARYAAAGRRRGRELEALRQRMADVTGDLERSHDELEEAYAQLQGAQAELVSSARLATLGDLIRGVAHEINTPLGALSSNYDVSRRALERLQIILEDEVVDADELVEVRKIVKAVDGVQATNAMAVERMEKLVKSLRTFGRPDRSEIDRVDLHEALESTLQIVKHQLTDGMRVEREFGELPLVECYAHQVNQVFMNLLVNAIHALDGEGTITIRTRAQGDAVEVEVEDTGVGIPEKDRARIFEPGFTTKGKRVGMGLGLLISSQIVERHSGRISVESEVGRGTTFRVRLPLRLPGEAAGAASPPSGGAAGDRGPVPREAAEKSVAGSGDAESG